MKKRVVVTGLGTVCPVGLNTAQSWENILSGRSGIGPITAFDPDEFGTKTRIAGEVKDFDPREFMEGKEAKRMDRFTQFAVVAAAEALEHSGLDLSGENATRVGTIIASGVGGIITLLDQEQVLRKSGARRVNPFTVPMLMSNAAAGAVSIRFGSRGPSFSVASACASTTDGVGVALDLIRSGRSRAMIAGGVEAPIHPISVAAFEQAHALSRTHNDTPALASKPFDLNRDGFVLSEGGAILILEDADYARARGAEIICELIGYGSASDSYHITAPAPDAHGAVQAMTIAMEDAEIDPGAVAYINAHGTSTELNDKMEALAIHTVFGERARSLPVSSTKSMTGHLGGAAGSIEAVFGALAAQTGHLPPTINYETPDPDCDLDVVPNKMRRIDPGVVLSNSFGFGGHCATLAFRPWIP